MSRPVTPGLVRRPCWRILVGSTALNDCEL